MEEKSGLLTLSEYPQDIGVGKLDWIGMRNERGEKGVEWKCGIG